MTALFQKIFFSFFEKARLEGILTITSGGKVFVFGQAVSGSENDKIAKADITVLDKRFFKQVVINGDIGLGEAYFLSYFSTSNLNDLLKWFIQNRQSLPGFNEKRQKFLLFEWSRLISKIFHFFNKNTKSGSKRNIKKHYDISNDFYKLWLDETMTYSAAVFENSDNLKEAQENKYRKICEKISLKSSDRLLEIGSGWAGFAIFAVKNYACRVTTTTISSEQFKLAQERVAAEKLEDKIEIIFKDYRDLSGSFDKIVSIEMMEALGHEYLETFIDKCNALIKNGGKICLQCITIPDKIFPAYLKNNNYIKKYIFPGGELISLGQLETVLKKNTLLCLDLIESIGLDYARTLNHWKRNFLKQEREIRSLGFDEVFYKKWLYYFAYCEVGFETKYLDDVQILISKK